LIWASNPDLTNEQVREILQTTAEDLGLAANQQGHGLVRADLAVTATHAAQPLIHVSTHTESGTVADGENGLASIKSVLQPYRQLPKEDVN
ncbi:MAG: hypothetical protein IBX64_13140, partial [Actinobacteria bacterium]|nr:hypothetical protein [Actinomycetota bacterium]